MSPKQVHFINRQKGIEKEYLPVLVKTSKLSKSPPTSISIERRIREVIRVPSPPLHRTTTVTTNATTREVAKIAAPPPPPSSVSSRRASTTIPRKEVPKAAPSPPASSAATSTIHSHVRVSPPASARVKTGPGSTSQDAINSSLKSKSAPTTVSVRPSHPPAPSAPPTTKPSSAKAPTVKTVPATKAPSVKAPPPPKSAAPPKAPTVKSSDAKTSASPPAAPSPPSSTTTTTTTTISIPCRESSITTTYKVITQPVAPQAPQTALTVRVKDTPPKPSPPSSPKATDIATLPPKDAPATNTTVTVHSLSRPQPTPHQVSKHLLTKTTTYAFGSSQITSLEEVGTTTTITLPQAGREPTALIIDDSNMSVLARIATAKVVMLPAGARAASLAEPDSELKSPRLVEIKSSTQAGRRREERRLVDDDREPRGGGGGVVYERERWELPGREERRASVVSCGSGLSRRGSKQERNRDGKVVLIVG